MRDNVCYAGFAARFCAWLLDMLVVCVPVSIIKAIALTGGPLSRAVLFRYSPLDIAAYALPTLYFIAMTWSQGATVGKMVMKLEVISAERGHLTLWQTVLREVFGRYLSVTLLLIGYFMIIPDREKRALHDRIADTRVVYAIRTQPDFRRPQPVDDGDAPA